MGNVSLVQLQPIRFDSTRMPRKAKWNPDEYDDK